MTENDIEGFKAFLESEIKTDGKHYEAAAIESRIAKLKEAEKIVGNVNVAVQSEEFMYKSLLILKEKDNPNHSPLQNALRRYWKFKNGYEFLPLKKYERTYGIVEN